MRFVGLIAIAVVSGVTGCATFEQDQVAIGEEFWHADSWRGAEVIAVDEDPAPAATPRSRSVSPLRNDGDVTPPRFFEVGAAHAKLGNVDISDCWSEGTRGYGHLKVTFDGNGETRLVEVLNPVHGAPVPDKVCVAERLRAVAVPSFDGSPVAVKTSFWVP